MLNLNETYQGYNIIEYLGGGKAADSYLVKKNEHYYVLKKMHLKPFINGHIFRVKDELESYNKLISLGLNMPELIDYDENNQYLIKAYIEGKNLAYLIKDNQIPVMLYHAFYIIIEKLESLGYTIDYFPTNFIVNENKLFYVDYEINPYQEMWDYKNWGVHFWFNTEGFKLYFPNQNMEKLSDPNTPELPIKEMTAPKVNQLYHDINAYNFSNLAKKLKLDTNTIVINQKQHGMAATSFEIKDDHQCYFVKYYPLTSKLDDIKSEIQAASNTNTTLPKLVHYDLSCKHHQFYVLVFEYIDGFVLMDLYDNASPSLKKELTTKFTKTLIDIHAQKTTGSSVDFISVELKEIRDIISISGIKGLDQVISYLENHKTKIHSYQLSRLHGDYHPWNIMIEKNQLYVIDWKYKIGDFRYDVYWTYTLLIRSGFENLAKQFLYQYQGFIPHVLNDQNYFMILASTRWLVNVILSINQREIEENQIEMFSSFIEAYSDLVSQLLKISITIKY